MKWHFLDINHLSNIKNYHSSVDSFDLAKLIFDSFFDANSENTLFSITHLFLEKNEINEHIDKVIKDLSIMVPIKESSVSERDKTNSRNVNVLTLAAMEGNEDAVVNAIKNHALVNSKTESESTALMLAAQNGHIEIVKKLFKAGASEEYAKKKNGVGLLMMAALRGHKDLVAFLLEREGIKNQINDKDIHGINALMFSTIHGGDTLEIMLRSNEVIKHINEIDKTGASALIHAVKNNNFRAVQLLISHEADPRVKDIHGVNALMFSTLARDDILEMLLNSNEIKQYINERDHTGSTALMHAVKSKNLHAVQLLLSHGADPKIKTNNGNDSLIISLLNKSTEITKALVKSNADINVFYCQKQFTPVMIAAMNGDVDLVKFFMEKDPNVLKVKSNPVEGNVSHKTKNTALMLAAQYGQIKVVELLIDKEPTFNDQLKVLSIIRFKINIKNDEELLNFFTKNGYNEIAKVYRKAQFFHHSSPDASKTATDPVFFRATESCEQSFSLKKEGVSKTQDALPQKKPEF